MLLLVGENEPTAMFEPYETNDQRKNNFLSFAIFAPDEALYKFYLERNVIIQIS